MSNDNEMPLAFIQQRPAGWAVMHDNGMTVDRPMLVAFYESKDEAEAHANRINDELQQPGAIHSKHHPL